MDRKELIAAWLEELSQQKRGGPFFFWSPLLTTYKGFFLFSDDGAHLWSQDIGSHKKSGKYSATRGPSRLCRLLYVVDM
jgi:hypothetical protein